MSALYVYRLDDITPEMNWTQFWTYIELFTKHRVMPLLGVVPDNRDTDLAVDCENPEFWTILRQLDKAGRVEFSQHGYQHRYESNRQGLLRLGRGLKCQSEFAGLPYEIQLRKIQAGRELLRKNGIFTDIWMAPAHSFDLATLRALRASGFGALTDGIALYPYRQHDLLFVPQQLWRPKLLPLGVWTICLHINRRDDKLFLDVKNHLSSGAKIVCFGEARRVKAGFAAALANKTFGVAHKIDSVRRAIIQKR